MGRKNRKPSEMTDKQRADKAADEKAAHQAKLQEHKENIKKRKQVLGEKWWELHTQRKEDKDIVKIHECYYDKGGDRHTRFVGTAAGCRTFLEQLRAKEKKQGVKLLYDGKRKSA